MKVGHPPSIGPNVLSSPHEVRFCGFIQRRLVCLGGPPGTAPAHFSSVIHSAARLDGILRRTRRRRHQLREEAQGDNVDGLELLVEGWWLAHPFRMLALALKGEGAATCNAGKDQ
jgi:hypothetical protein